ncbi:MAG: cytochrome c1 [Alphaproteobacteria bacterium]|nr:cytochrome c1 [Alphaproteobacteria bacterium]
MSKTILALIVAGSIAVSAAPALAAGEAATPPKEKWSFSGPFGKYDRAQLQRGFKIYREVCQICHGLKLVAFRNLADLGYSEAQVKAIAGEYKIQDGPNDQGEMFEREGRPADRFPPPWPNENAARARYNGVPPDLSVIAKARTYERGFPYWLGDMFTQYQEHGPDYIAAMLQGYSDPPAGTKVEPPLAYNKFFPGGALAMPKPMEDGRVTYDDGSPQTLAQYSKDVTAFLMWTAEPHMEARKKLGFQVMIFLIVLGGLLYFTKKKVWVSAH